MATIQLRNYELWINGEKYIERLTTPDNQIPCEFDVEIFPGMAWSTARIGLFNIAASSSPVVTDGQEQTASVAFQANDTVQLLAGYTTFDETGGVLSESVGTVFTGHVANCYRERSGANIITWLMCNSGVSKSDRGQVSQTYDKGASLYDVITDIVRNGWQKPLNFGTDPSRFRSIKGPFSVIGTAYSQLQELAKIYNFQFTQDNTGIVVSFPNDARSGAVKYPVSMFDGMVGMPVVSAANGVFVDVDVILNANMTTQDIIVIDSQFQQYNNEAAGQVVTSDAKASGEWSIMSLRHRGETNGQKWITSIHGIKVGSQESEEVNARPRGSVTWGKTITQDDRIALKQVCQKLGIEPSWLSACIQFESKWNPQARNNTSGAVGLIQFTTAGMPKGYTKARIAAMTAAEQLQGPVYDYFYPYRGRITSVDECYTAIFAPAHLGKPSSTVLYSAPSAAYEQNRNLDVNGDGMITKAEACAPVRKLMAQGWSVSK